MTPFLLLLVFPHLGFSISNFYLSPQVDRQAFETTQLQTKWMICQRNRNLITQGSNSWDGTSPTHSAGTNSGPWATLQHAIEALRLTLWSCSSTHLENFQSPKTRKAGTWRPGELAADGRHLLPRPDSQAQSSQGFFPGHLRLQWGFRNNLGGEGAQIFLGRGRIGENDHL